MARSLLQMLPKVCSALDHICALSALFSAVSSLYFAVEFVLPAFRVSSGIFTLM